MTNSAGARSSLRHRMIMKRIGILNGGGDCPGLNAVTHGVVGAANTLGWEVVGFRDGFEGLLPPGDYKLLKRSKTQGILKLGGTILGTTNRGHFSSKQGAGETVGIERQLIEDAKKTIHQLGVEALIVVGGDGTLSTALQFQRAGVPVIGVPKTIDNDLQATAMTFGFDSAVSTVVDALDRLHTTAESHKRVMVVEVMGRHTGWIALFSGIGGGADIILIPEIPFHYSSIAKAIRKRESEGNHTTLVVVAEGSAPEGGHQLVESNEGAGEYRLGGIGDRVACEIERLTGKETRSCTLGHLQRGGSPTSWDRVLATRFGVKAVHLIRDGCFGHMVSYQSYQVGSVPIEEAVEKLKLVDPDGEVVGTARAVGISFGD